MGNSKTLVDKVALALVDSDLEPSEVKQVMDMFAQTNDFKLVIFDGYVNETEFSLTKSLGLNEDFNKSLYEKIDNIQRRIFDIDSSLKQNTNLFAMVKEIAEDLSLDEIKFLCLIAVVNDCETKMKSLIVQKLLKERFLDT